MFKQAIPVKLTLQDSINSYSSYFGLNHFKFLNLSEDFADSIDWNYDGFDKLWTYNLNYFDFINQKNIEKADGMRLINDFIDGVDSIKDGLESFPVSLRGINWIKFLTKHDINDKTINNSLYAQYYILLDNIEYHLLGNHLLENGFSLLFGAYYFQDQVLYNKAKQILTDELKEQILDDGAHFELSPMYHQIMLFRVLDCYNLVKNSQWMKQELLSLLKRKAELMLGWLNQLAFSNGDIPLLNDSANGIASTTKQLNTYADNLKLRTQNSPLKECGYRKKIQGNYEIVMDIRDIGPDYIPGHAHADTFNFELRIDSLPFIVDTGLSTYETGLRRDLERGSSAHNTVVVNSTNSSDIWGGFRVANRAKIIAFEENDKKIKVTHNGYKKEGVLHTRTFKFEDDKIIIIDELDKDISAKVYLHFHPDVNESEIRNRIKIKNAEFKFLIYSYAPEFNKLITAKKIEITFENKLITEINTKK